ncbi:hypothetical protein F6X56_15070 [Rhodococcus erythropolis]|uniref:hypothetical protein n=1 Tax=Rhodococcus erythropolis TaxID=1833 RepID=UPI0012459390|nr:hypothetical protein [Rhodococcus erythropolis]QEX10943.1 hypothetical protein F6X56_15070 [Rhodococcus erythropolis]
MTQDQELFELCKEVYKRFPEWKTGRHIWSMKRPVICKGDDFMDGMSFPLYTSDYLLEKLQSLMLIQLDNAAGRWRAEYSDNAGFSTAVYADTPLKALLKLVIALANAGVKL